MVSRHTFVRLALVVATSGLASALLLVNNIALARVLSPILYGDYIAAFTLVSGGMFFASFGVPQVLMRAYGHNAGLERPLYAAGLKIMALSSIASCLAILVILSGQAFTDQTRMIAALLLPTILAQVLADLASVHFQAIDKHWLAGGWLAALSALRLVATIAFLVLRPPLFWLPLLHSAAAIAFGVMTVVMIRRALRKKPLVEADHTPRSQFRAVTAEAAPYITSNMMYFLSAQAPLIIFGALAGSKATAIYGVGALVLSTIYFVPQVATIRFLLMHYHKMVAERPEVISRLYKLGTLAAAGAGALISVVGWLLAPLLIPLVFGRLYTDAIAIVAIMLLCVPLRFATVNIAALLAANGEMWMKNKADIVGAVLSLIAFLVLVPLYAEKGGAIAAVLSEVFMLGAHVVLVLYLRRRAA